MKKNKFSLAEKKLVRILIVLSLIQSVIIFTFSHILIESRQIDISDVKIVDITVDDIYYFRVPRENWLFIVADSTKYLFKSRSTFEEYSINDLYAAISEDSKLSLMYFETYEIFGRVNLVVDARSETEIYRSVEEYNHGKQGVPVFVVIVFSVIEIVFVGIILVYVFLNYSIFKSILKKLSQRAQVNRSSISCGKTT